MGCQCFRAGVCNGTIVHVRVITVTKVLLCTCKYICVCICIGLLYISAKKKTKKEKPHTNVCATMQLHQHVATLSGERVCLYVCYNDI